MYAQFVRCSKYEEVYVFMLCQPRELNSVSANEFLTTENLMPIEINRQVKLNDDQFTK